MKIKKIELLEILSKIKPGLAKRGIIEATDHFIFTGYDIVTYNDQICIVYPFDCDIKFSVPANEFYKVVQNAPTKEIEFTLEDEKLKIKYSKAKGEIPTTSAESVLSMIDSLELPAVMKKLEPLPEDFIQGVGMCAFSASTDPTMNVLNCLLIEDNWILSSDDLRISQYKMKNMMDCSVLIPVSAINELVKFPVVDFCTHNNWVFFATKEDVLFCCRLVNGKYNEYAKFFNNFDGQEITLPDTINKMIESAAIFAEGDTETDKLIDIEIANKKIKVRGESTKGWIETPEDISVDCEKIRFSINPLFFQKILGYTKNMTFFENRALFSSGSFKHLMALRVDE